MLVFCVITPRSLKKDEARNFCCGDKTKETPNIPDMNPSSHTKITLFIVIPIIVSLKAHSVYFLVIYHYS